MKMITSLFAVTLLVASAASAMADQQRSDEAPGYALSRQMSPGPAVRRGAYAADWSERSGGARASVPFVHDFGNDPNIIHFQEQGSH